MLYDELFYRQGFVFRVPMSYTASVHFLAFAAVCVVASSLNKKPLSFLGWMLFQLIMFISECKKKRKDVLSLARSMETLHRV